MTAADKTILIVDDDVDFLILAGAVLKKTGYKVKSLAVGALKEIFAMVLSCDILLLDIDLPGESGAEISSQLKINPKTRNIPIIMITGNADGEEISKQAKADGFLLKPFSVAMLLEKIKQAFGG